MGSTLKKKIKYECLITYKDLLEYVDYKHGLKPDRKNAYIILHTNETVDDEQAGATVFEDDITINRNVVISVHFEDEVE